MATMSNIAEKETYKLPIQWLYLMVHVFKNRKGEQNLHLENIFLGNNVEGGKHPIFKDS